MAILISERNAKILCANVQIIALDLWEQATDSEARTTLTLCACGARPVCTVERFIDGDYVKYNNNWDWVDDRRNTPQVSQGRGGREVGGGLDGG